VVARRWKTQRARLRPAKRFSPNSSASASKRSGAMPVSGGSGGDTRGAARPAGRPRPPPPRGGARPPPPPSPPPPPPAPRAPRLVPPDHRPRDGVARRRPVRQVVAQPDQPFLEDRAERPHAGLLRLRAPRDGAQGLGRELELRLLEPEDALELPHQRVLRLDQDADEVVLQQRVEHADHRQAADELGDHPELDQVLALDLAEEVLGLLLVLRAHAGVVADAALPDAAADDLLELDEGAADDEQDVAGVHLQVVLLGMLAPALRRDVGDG